MKRIFAMLLVLLSLEAEAKCASRGLHTWPALGSKIAGNSIFVVEGYASSESIIEQIGTTYHVYLRSGSSKIRLNAKELLKGQFHLTQVVLKADSLLVPGNYELIIEGLADHNYDLDQYNALTEKWEKPNWKVIAEQDRLSPAWNSAPTFKSWEMEMFGCGPSVFAGFSLDVSEISDLLVRTTVKDLSTGAESSYYIHYSDGLANVGHGMCSGAFKFKSNTKYLVSFTLMDSSGNKSAGSEGIEIACVNGG
jgi:hypothetical protein